MFDWIMLTLGAVYLILVLIEVFIGYFSLKDIRVYERLKNTFISILDNKHKDEAMNQK